MKTIKFLLLLTLAIFLFSCSDDDNNEMNLTSLKQTSWKGSYITGEGENEVKATVGLVFYTEKDGYSDLMYNKDELYRDNFTYTANEKLLVISGSNIAGNWLLVHKDKNTMVLENGTGGNPSTKIRMILEKEV